MSQTATNRPSELAVHTKAQQTTDSLSPTYSTKDSASSVSAQSRLGATDTENQFSLSTESTEELTSGDIKELESVERQLSRESVHKHNYQKDFIKLQQELKKIMDSKLPVSLKVSMMQSLMEKVRTNINCVKEINTVMKENIKKNQDYSKQQAQQKAVSTPTKRVAPPEPSPVVKQSEEEESMEDVKKEIKKLEETIAQMKQTRNSLTMSLEDKADSIQDIQALLKERKQTLDRKTIMVENMKMKISNTSDKKTNTKSGGATHRKTHSEMGLNMLKNYLKGSKKNESDKTVDMSTSRLETSVLKEMSSKIGNVWGKMGKVFGKKDGKVSEQILSTEFMRELENQSTPVSLNNSMSQPSRREMNLSISNFNFK